MTATPTVTTADASSARTDPEARSAEATTAIEALLAWSSDALAGLIGLGELSIFLDAGGPLALAAPRIRREVDRTAAALAQLPDLLHRLWDIAERGHDDAEGRRAQEAADLLTKSIAKGTQAP